MFEIICDVLEAVKDGCIHELENEALSKCSFFDYFLSAFVNALSILLLPLMLLDKLAG